MTFTRHAWLVVLTVCALAAPLRAHPHYGDIVTDTIRGRVTGVDAEQHTIAIDAIDRKTKKLRNYLVFLDPKVKITRAKKKVALGELAPGQPIICVVEVEIKENGQEGRLTAFDIQFDLKARPAVY